MTKPLPDHRRANFNGKAQTRLLPLKKARPAQRYPPGRDACQRTLTCALWCRYVDRIELAAQRGTCFLDLQMPKAAIGPLTEAISLIGSGAPRPRGAGAGVRRVCAGCWQMTQARPRIARTTCAVSARLRAARIVAVTLFVRPLITDTVLLPALAAYTMSVRGFAATAIGLLPTWMKAVTLIPPPTPWVVLPAAEADTIAGPPRRIQKTST